MYDLQLILVKFGETFTYHRVRVFHNFYDSCLQFIYYDLVECREKFENIDLNLVDSVVIKRIKINDKGAD